MAETERVRVWALPVRLVHWGLVTCVATAWLTGHGPGWLHDGAGYVLLGLIVLRVIRGVVGPPPDRFVGFVAGLRGTLVYTRKVLSRREARFLGHNPLGGWMIVALLTVAFATSATGWLYTTDRFWGIAWMESLHVGLAVGLLVLIALHIAGVVFTSIRQGENLAGAMMHGWKPRTTARHPERAIDP